jgi:hypothetical protein
MPFAQPLRLASRRQGLPDNSAYLNRACGRRWRQMNGSREVTIKAHLAELERQHKALEHGLAEALAHSSTDDLKITELKRRKLILKDEIERVRHDHAL